MTVKLTPTESETIFHNALCNGLGYVEGYGIELDFNKKEKKRKAAHNLGRAQPGCSHGCPIAQLGAVGCRLTTQKAKTTPPAPRVPGSHRKRAEEPPCVPFSSGRPTMGRGKPSKGRAGCLKRSLAPLSGGKRGRREQLRPTPANGRPNLPLHTTRVGHAPPFPTPTHKHRRGVREASRGKANTLARTQKWRFGRVHILHALGAAGATVPSTTRDTYITHVSTPGENKRTQSTQAHLHGGNRTPTSTRHRTLLTGPHRGQYTETRGTHPNGEDGEKERDTLCRRCEPRRECPIGHHPDGWQNQLFLI